ncbi:MAG: hypothetical protein J6M18_01535, partial [Actinomycetaceae bacterium]|nr:hypothetical protein [Actinomycetaceae bacterium]
MNNIIETTPAQTASIQSTAVPRQSMFSSPQYKSSLWRMFLSELYKLSVAWGYWVTVVLAVFVHVSFALISNAYDPVYFSSEYVTDFASLTIFFITILAALSVSSEYTHNTMRTTSLSSAHRLTAFHAKMMANIVYHALFSGLIIVLTLLIHMTFALDVDFDGYKRPLFVYWVLLTLSSVMAAGLAYVVRSTAGAVTIIIGVFLVANILTIIDNETWRNFLINGLPSQALSNAVMDDAYAEANKMWAETQGLTMWN